MFKKKGNRPGELDKGDKTVMAVNNIKKQQCFFSLAKLVCKVPPIDSILLLLHIIPFHRLDFQLSLFLSHKKIGEFVFLKKNSLFQICANWIQVCEHSYLHFINPEIKTFCNLFR